VPPAFSSRLALVAWAIAALGGTAAVWWLSTYLESLTALAQTDRGAALELFRTRAMPALLLVVGVAVAAGAVLLRQGLQMARAEGREGRFLGNMIATAGFLLAAIPLALISVVFWVLARA
jgi:hypothetical protein